MPLTGLAPLDSSWQPARFFVINDRRLQANRVDHRSFAGFSLHNLGSGQQVAAGARRRGRRSAIRSAAGFSCSGGATMWNQTTCTEESKVVNYTTYVPYHCRSCNQTSARIAWAQGPVGTVVPGTVVPTGPHAGPRSRSRHVSGERVGAGPAVISVLAIFSLSSSFRTSSSQPSACSRSCSGTH